MKERFKSVAIIVLLAITASQVVGSEIPWVLGAPAAVPKVEATLTNGMWIGCRSDGKMEIKPGLQFQP